MEKVKQEQGLKILVLESSKQLTKEIQLSLKRSGITFISQNVDSKSELAECMKQFNPDVILADLDKINGELNSALSIIREQGPNTPFICLSKFPVIQSEELHSEGVADCLPKDNMSKLGSSLRKALEDVHERVALQQTEASLRLRLLQQSAVAELGQLALGDADINELKTKAVEYLADALPADFTNINEIISEDSLNLLVTAGIGWPDDVVNKRILHSREGSVIRFILDSNSPVIADDIQSETRFDIPQFLSSLNIKSGIYVTIKSKGKNYGTLCAHTLESRSFAKEDLHFLQSISNILASAFDKRATELALRQSETNFNALTEHTEDPIWSVGANHKVLSLNPAYKVLYYATNGVELEKGMDIFENRAQNKQSGLDNFSRVMNGEKLRFERQYLVNGVQKFYEVTVSPIRTDEGTISGAAYFSRDITQRKIAEDKIKKSEERYRKLIETMHEGVVYVDNSEIIQLVNERFCELTGYAIEELIGKVASDFLINEKDKGMMEGKMELRTQGFGDQYELQLLRKSGELIWTMVNGIPITDEDGNIIGSMATYSDISEIKKTENRLKATNQELNTFVYKSSHDLKGPLASIMGLTNLARNEILDPESLHYLDLISQSANRLDSILSDLLETVRIKENAICAEMVQISPLLDDIMSTLSTIKGFGNIKYSINVDSDCFFVTDKKILRSIIQNLIDNSIKYRDTEKNISLLSISIFGHNDGLKISVEDNGVGIPEQIQDKVFDMFYRGNLESKGTGLGLYIVKNGVEKLGGAIKMESEPQKSTKFVVDIPNIFE